MHTFEIVEEILFRFCEIGVWKRGCESVEVDGRVHVARSGSFWWVVKVGKSVLVGPRGEPDRESKSHLLILIDHSLSTSQASVFVGGTTAAASFTLYIHNGGIPGNPRLVR